MKKNSPHVLNYVIGHVTVPRESFGPELHNCKVTTSWRHTKTILYVRLTDHNQKFEKSPIFYEGQRSCCCTQEHCSVAGIFVQSYNYITPRKDPFCRWTSLAKSQSAEIRKIAKFYNEGQRSCCCTYKLSSVEGLILQSFSPLPPLEHTLHKFVDEMKYGKWTRRKIEKKCLFFISRSKVMLLHRPTLLGQGYNLTKFQPSSSTARQFWYETQFLLRYQPLVGISQHFHQMRVTTPRTFDRRLWTSPSFKVMTLNVTAYGTIQQPYPVSYLLSIDHFRLSWSV